LKALGDLFMSSNSLRLSESAEYPEAVAASSALVLEDDKTGPVVIPKMEVPFVTDVDATDLEMGIVDPRRLEGTEELVGIPKGWMAFGTEDVTICEGKWSDWGDMVEGITELGGGCTIVLVDSFECESKSLGSLSGRTSRVLDCHT
jgi:hypothetical protein